MKMNETKTYRVTAIQQVLHEVEVEANSIEEAEEIAKENADDWNWCGYLDWVDYEAEEMSGDKYQLYKCRE
tara:strand:+ start:331 stop:543 length:213 start_codon:yes stop_codon:yes gene_type:complete